MLQKPLYLAKMMVLMGYVDYCLLKVCSKDSKLIQQAMTSIPFRAASSSQSSHLVNVFVYLFCLFCRYLFATPRPIEPLRLIDGKRFWLLPRKHD